MTGPPELIDVVLMVTDAPEVPTSRSTIPAPPAVLVVAKRAKPAVPDAEALVCVMAPAVSRDDIAKLSVAPLRPAPETGSAFKLDGNAVYDPATVIEPIAVIAPPATVTLA